jgi:hypothetical protein
MACLHEVHISSLSGALFRVVAVIVCDISCVRAELCSSVGKGSW